MYNFRETAGNGAGGRADDGRGKLALLPERFATGPQYGGSAQAAPMALAEQLVQRVQSRYPQFSRALILDYYAALASSPLVFVAAADPRSGTALMCGFAEALVGLHSPQHVVVANTEWHRATGEDRHYHTVQQRFRALRCQELAHEAAEPGNMGKAYFVCFESLAACELEMHVALFSNHQQVALSAVIPADECAASLACFPHATLIEVHAPFSAAESGLVPPPVGVQRLWLQERAQTQRYARHSNGEAAALAERRWLARSQWREVLAARGIWREPYDRDEVLGSASARRAA